METGSRVQGEFMLMRTRLLILTGTFIALAGVLVWCFYRSHEKQNPSDMAMRVEARPVCPQNHDACLEAYTYDYNSPKKTMDANGNVSTYRFSEDISEVMHNKSPSAVTAQPIIAPKMPIEEPKATHSPATKTMR